MEIACEGLRGDAANRWPSDALSSPIEYRQPIMYLTERQTQI
jgi:hypothetical protein